MDSKKIYRLISLGNNFQRELRTFNCQKGRCSI